MLTRLLHVDLVFHIIHWLELLLVKELSLQLRVEFDYLA